MIKQAIGMSLMIALMCIAMFFMSFPFYVAMEGPDWLMWFTIPILLIGVPGLYIALALIVKYFPLDTNNNQL